MSACPECLVAATVRSHAVDRLEADGVSTSVAAQLLELDAGSLSERLGIAKSTASEHADVWALCRHDEGFPLGLFDFVRENDVPRVLFGRGDRSLLMELVQGNGVALVGARRASAYGRELAYQLGNDAAARGLTVVSGMALGIDGAAHRGALQGGGPTVAVLAGGPDAPYPRSHRLLYEQILERGCVVSENPPGSEARRWAFVARNRIIAALAQMTVWIEGTESSGARHTIDFAEQLGRTLGVVPGPVNSAMSTGPNGRLTDEGVVAVRGIDDITDSLALEFLDTFHATPPPSVSREEAQLLDLIASGHRTPRSLFEQLSGVDPREISRTLGLLELNGFLIRDSNGEYRQQARHD